MSLTNWHTAGWVVEHKTTPEEIRDLFAVSERDLKDSEVAGISPDAQLGLAYNAALQVCAAALAAAGYRASRDRKHYVRDSARSARTSMATLVSSATLLPFTGIDALEFPLDDLAHLLRVV